MINLEQLIIIRNSGFNLERGGYRRNNTRYLRPKTRTQDEDFYGPFNSFEEISRFIVEYKMKNSDFVASYSSGVRRFRKSIESHEHEVVRLRAQEERALEEWIKRKNWN